MRPDGRQPDQLRPIRFQRDFTVMTPGSVLVEFGRTRVLCTVSIEDDVPRWMKGRGSGWVTAEYAMLPGSSPERVRRRESGRSQEIQRLIGRALRNVCDMVVLGERNVLVDCDVLQADGGTRTASICGGYVALHDAFTRLIQAGELAAQPLTTECAAVSVGIVHGRAVLDLPYEEDSIAETDMNVVMTGSGRYVEVQGTAEGVAFDRAELDSMLGLAEAGIREIAARQRAALAEPPPRRRP
ncbi:MAG: ribonuclease PH [Acidimicrobiales bacterium]